jgi:hypothetical protein
MPRARRTSIKVECLEWDDENEGHQVHGLNLWIADQVKDNLPQFFSNRADRTGTHKMIGPDNNQRFWTVILLRTTKPGIWRPITGWPSSESEIEAYVQARRSTRF